MKLPDGLTRRTQWVLWKMEERDGKPTKVPYQTSGEKARSNDPSTWSTYEEVCAVRDQYDGIGIMFGDGLAGIDLDHVEDDEIRKAISRMVIETMDTYTEKSPSGTGIHLLFTGKIPAGRRKHTGYGFEIYEEGRFFTVTGQHVKGTPMTINERTEQAAQIHENIFPPKTERSSRLSQPSGDGIIEKIRASKQGDKFSRLFAGDTTGYASQSEADLALCSILAFWTGNDVGEMDRLFRVSGLMRPKWDEMRGEKTYGETTIESAADMTQETYHARDNGSRPAPEKVEPEGKPRVVILSAADAYKPQPPIEYIVDGLIPTGSVNVFYGEPGSKKTYSLLSMAVDVAGGLEWCGMSVEQSPVLIIDEESGKRRMLRRLHDALAGEQLGPDTPVYFVSLASFKMDDPADEVVIQGLIEETGARLVIIDALADVMDGDENSKKETQPVFNALRRVAEATDSAIIVIHHANKGGGYRGTSAIKGAVDTLVQVQSETGRNLVVFTSEKTRDGEGKTWAAEAAWTSNTFNLFPAFAPEHKQRLSKSQAYVIRCLESGNKTLSEIMDGADTCSAGAAKKAVYDLVDRKMVERINPGARGVEATYAIHTA